MPILALTSSGNVTKTYPVRQYESHYGGSVHPQVSVSIERHRHTYSSFRIRTIDTIL